MKNLVLFAITTVAVLFLLSPAARANDAKLIGTFGDWAAYSFTENGNKVCYMAGQPKKAEGNYTKRGDVFALITHRPAESTKNVFSYITGYSYKPGSDATVTIDSETFTLFTQDDTAWTSDSATDDKIADAIRKGSKLVVKGTSGRGTQTTDTFGLKGSADAHDAITKECGL